MNDKCSMVLDYIRAGVNKVVAIYEACDIVITEMYEVEDIRFTGSNMILGSLSNGSVISINMDNVAINTVSAEDSKYTDDEELLIVADDWRVTLSAI